MGLLLEISITKKLNSKSFLLDGPLGRLFYLVERVSWQVFRIVSWFIPSPPSDATLSVECLKV